MDLQTSDTDVQGTDDRPGDDHGRDEQCRGPVRANPDAAAPATAYEHAALVAVSPLAPAAYRTFVDALNASATGVRESRPFEALPADEQRAWSASALAVARAAAVAAEYRASQRQGDAERIMQRCVSAAVEGATLTALRELACPAWEAHHNQDDEEE